TRPATSPSTHASCRPHTTTFHNVHCPGVRPRVKMLPDTIAGIDTTVLLAIGGGVLAVLLLVIFLATRRKALPAPQQPEAKLPAEIVVPKVTLAPSELESQKLREAEEARARAEEARRQRDILAKGDAQRAAELKAVEEEAKK